MKKYCFDYIEKEVSKWDVKLRTNANAIKGIPNNTLVPLILLNEKGESIYVPAKDYYGEEIEDINDWVKQRDEYCEKLANKNKKK